MYYLYTLRNGVDSYHLKYLEFSSLLFNPKISTATTSIYYVLVTNLIPIQLTSSVVVCYSPTHQPHPFIAFLCPLFYTSPDILIVIPTPTHLSSIVVGSICRRLITFIMCLLGLQPSDKYPFSMSTLYVVKYGLPIFRIASPSLR